MPKTKLKQKEWWADGIRFQCQGSGKCCVSRDEYGFVFLTKNDQKNLAKHLGISTSAFTKKYCTKLKGLFHLNEDPKDPNCLFLQNKKCSVYEARPTQCRTWPFWPEVMNPKTWKNEVATFCPGVGKGPKVSAKIIERAIAEQKLSEDELIRSLPT